MPSPVAIRAGAAVLRRLGLQSTLDGVDCGPVHFQRSVQVYHGDVATTQSVVTISNTATPAPGQVLVHPDGTFRLESRLEDNGVNSRWIVL